MAKYGGGTAGYFGILRERGATVTNNGTSSGAVHFMEPYETISNVKILKLMKLWHIHNKL